MSEPIAHSASPRRRPPPAKTQPLPYRIATTTPFQTPGAAGEPILADHHAPTLTPPRAHVLIAHGLLGYKDYGFLPLLAADLASSGFAATRFNFSHSGMTRQTARFERPDLFRLDTWNKQVADLHALMRHATGELTPGIPLVLLGHSRGGAAVLLAAGRPSLADLPPADRPPAPAAVVTIAAPSSCCRMSPEDRERLQTQGFINLTSARTRQRLPRDRAWLDEQLADPHNHDPVAAAANLPCPYLAVQGDADTTVTPENADRLAAAAREAGVETTLAHLPDADHVLNTPNPAPAGDPPSPQLAAACNAIARLLASLSTEQGG